MPAQIEGATLDQVGFGGIVLSDFFYVSIPPLTLQMEQQERAQRGGSFQSSRGVLRSALRDGEQPVYI
jgi:hypothetical protein